MELQLRVVCLSDMAALSRKYVVLPCLKVIPPQEGKSALGLGAARLSRDGLDSAKGGRDMGM